MTPRKKTLIMSELQKIRDRKIRERQEDRDRLARDEVTRDELQWQNSIIPREVAEDREWKQVGLEAAIRSLGRPRSTVTLPTTLRHEPRAVLSD